MIGSSELKRTAADVPSLRLARSEAEKRALEDGVSVHRAMITKNDTAIVDCTARLAKTTSAVMDGTCTTFAVLFAHEREPETEMVGKTLVCRYRLRLGVPDWRWLPLMGALRWPTPTNEDLANGDNWSRLAA